MASLLRRLGPPVSGTNEAYPDTELSGTEGDKDAEEFKLPYYKKTKRGKRGGRVIREKQQQGAAKLVDQPIDGA